MSDARDSSRETSDSTTARTDAERTDGGVVADRTGWLDGVPRWVLAVVPVVLLVAALGVFFVATPFAAFQAGEPLPDVTVSYSTLPDDETIRLHVTNNGPSAVTIAQVLVDDAYWAFSTSGDRTLGAMESATIDIPYHWNPGWDLEVALVLSDGTTIHHEIVAPQQTPGLTAEVLWTLALIGLFVGVIPVVLGMLWFPVMRTMDDRWLHAILAFSAGLLAFLAFDAGFEAFELAEEVPGAFEGPLLVVLGTVGALFVVQAIGARRKSATTADGPATDGGTTGSSGLWIAYLVAVGIGLHNLAEGLAIGSSFALGRVSLGAFLVLGFMLHNVTEGPAVVAPVARGERPAVKHFVAMGLIAGAPVILGGWIGSLAFSPTLGAFFLAVGVGAILQVVWELRGLMAGPDGSAATATNLLAGLAGFAVMYLTDLLVAL